MHKFQNSLHLIGNIYLIEWQYIKNIVKKQEKT